MRKIPALLTVGALVFSTSALACNKKIDESKVMLFVDTNYSDKEIVVAQKAACSRGERLVVVPKEYKSYTKIIQRYEQAQKNADRCSSRSSNCSKQEKDLEAVTTELHNFNTARPSLNQEIRSQLTELKEQKAQIENFTISGHDGGGSFGGYKGSFNRQELLELMEEFPEVNAVKAVMLLGCYTGVQKEIMEWKAIFPDAKLIGGYDGSAPLSDRPMGHYYLEDLLLKEKEFLKQTDAKKVNDFALKNIRGLNELNAAIYLDPQCDEDYYFASKNRGDKFRSLNTRECQEKRAELDKMSQRYHLYYSGEIEPPQNPSSGELRNMYDTARSLEHCIELNNISLNVSNLFNLRFYEAVKSNFANYYKDDLKKAEEYINSIDPKEVEKGYLLAIEKDQAELKAQEESLLLMHNDPAKYFHQREEQLTKVKNEFEELLKNPGFKAVYDRFDLGSNNPHLHLATTSPEESKKLDKLWQMSNDVKYLMADIKYEKENRFAAIAVKRQFIDGNHHRISQRNLELAELRKDPQSLKKAWVPTQKNLAKKSRKETLENIHHLHKMMSLPGLSKRQIGTLSWVAIVSSEHLQQFQNPFSWHEYTGRTEDPEEPSRLNTYLDSIYSRRAR
jgi:hypothetical protein